MHFLNTTVERYTDSCALSVPLKYAKLKKQIVQNVHVYKFTTGPDVNFWIENAGITRENGRPDDAALWLFPE